MYLCFRLLLSSIIAIEDKSFEIMTIISNWSSKPMKLFSKFGKWKEMKQSLAVLPKTSLRFLRDADLSLEIKPGSRQPSVAELDCNLLSFLLRCGMELEALKCKAEENLTINH